MFFSKEKLALLLIFLFSGSVAFARELQVIYAEYPGHNIENADIRDIIRANRLTWKNGQNILLIIDDLDLITDEEFQVAFGTSKSMFLEAWRIKFFSGRALSPLQVKSQRKGLSYIEDNTNALFLTFQGFNQDLAPKGIMIKSL